MDGILNVYKEKGYTSHDVVAKLRGILRQKKIGHTGTLDPEAEGVLPVCIGRATKLCDLLTEKDKSYETVLKLGVTTDTQDMTGKILTQKEITLNETVIKEAVLSFVGEYDQLPPMYSALKVNGKKLYELAREGIEIERKTRQVMIPSIDILDINAEENEVKMKVECSKGTYIRTLCFDIGEKLKVGGAMKSLLRTRVERFRLEDSLKLSQVETFMKDGTLEGQLLSIETVFSCYDAFYVQEEKDRLLYNGNELLVKEGSLHNTSDTKIVRVYDSLSCFKGLYQLTEDKNGLKPYKMFL